jgi:hypothetical protein
MYSSESLLLFPQYIERPSCPHRQTVTSAVILMVDVFPLACTSKTNNVSKSIDRNESAIGFLWQLISIAAAQKVIFGTGTSIFCR